MHRGAVSRSGEVGFWSSPTLVSTARDLTAPFARPLGAGRSRHSTSHDDNDHHNYHRTAPRKIRVRGRAFAILRGGSGRRAPTSARAAKHYPFAG
jgi:hypothetical protein